MRRLAIAIGAAAMAAALAGAAAATLPVESERLTVSSELGGVPLSTCTVGAAADSYVDELNGLANFGTASSLSVRSAALENRRAFVRFDLSGCGIPSNASVRSATLVLYLSSAPSTSRIYALHRVLDSWTETGVTWLDQPGVASSSTATATTGTTSGVELRWDVLADVQAFAAGSAANRGWRVRDTLEGALLAVSGAFGSRERSTASERPRLEVGWYP